MHKQLSAARARRLTAPGAVGTGDLVSGSGENAFGRCGSMQWSVPVPLVTVSSAIKGLSGAARPAPKFGSGSEIQHLRVCNSSGSGQILNRAYLSGTWSDGHVTGTSRCGLARRFRRYPGLLRNH